MLSSYGYEDGSGTYYIAINTDSCCQCEEKSCVAACPAGLFEIVFDDYDDEVAVIREDARHRLKELCVICKNQDSLKESDNMLPCMEACHFGAIGHTW